MLTFWQSNLLVSTLLTIILSQAQNVISLPSKTYNKASLSSINNARFFDEPDDTGPLNNLGTVSLIVLGIFALGICLPCLCIYYCCKRASRTKGKVLQQNVNIIVEQVNNPGSSGNYQQQPQQQQQFQPPTPPPGYSVVDGHYQQQQQPQQQNYPQQSVFEEENLFRPGPSRMMGGIENGGQVQQTPDQFSPSRVLSSKVRII